MLTLTGMRVAGGRGEASSRAGVYIVESYKTQSFMMRFDPRLTRDIMALHNSALVNTSITSQIF